ncbi:MAG: endo-1,4-beta-xylanase [Vicingus serpentipes]|nr:endo-1,4-beta-xylanase [Vicingus serpentipes]
MKNITIKLSLLLSIFFFTSLFSYGQQVILIDDFEDGDLITNNWFNWRVFCYTENSDGFVELFENANDAGNRIVQAQFNNGTGAYANSAISLKFGGLTGLDMHKYSQIRFRAKGSAYPIEINLDCQPITDYSYYRKTAGTLTSAWQQFSVDLSTLQPPNWNGTSQSETGAVILDSCLKHAWAFNFNIMAPTGVVVDLSIDDVELVTNPAYLPPTTVLLPVGLKQAAQSANIDLGFAISPDYIGDSIYRELILQNATSITSEWGPVMSEIKRYPNRYDFSMADATIKWAHTNGLKVKGEHLIWHLSDPDWIKTGGYTTAQLDTIMKNYIQTTINYYKTNFPGTITHWCVVNEAIDDVTKSYRNTFWYQTFGEDYISKAFTYARQADPNVKLYYNDYNADGAGLSGNASEKADSLYNIIKRFKQQGVPIDGVGLQMHVSLENFPGKAAVLAQMNRLGALGLEVYVTEIDVAINEDLSGVSVPKYPQQAQVFRDVLEACIASPYCNDYTMWGITDRYSWYEQFFLKTDWPLITDFGYQPKESWNEILDALNLANPTAAVKKMNNNQETIICYPNPATTQITMESKEKEPLHLSMYNTIGELVIEEQLNIGINKIELNSLPKGMYFYNIKNTLKVVQTGKLIVN